MTRAHLLIRGRVQGVFYRASASDQGQRLGLRGWVRNLPGGEVEAEVEGPQEKVEAFLAWCRQGPPLARVDEVEVEARPYRGDLSGFSITR